MTAPRPPHLETKDTRGTLLGYIVAELPHVTRTGVELSAKEIAESQLAAGTYHAGAFDGKVPADRLGKPSDSPNARRVGEGYFPAEGPAGGDTKKRTPPASGSGSA